MRPVDYSKLPAHMQDGLRRYIEQGIPMGGFGTAVLANDFVGAALRADETNLRCLREWALWLTNECPRNAWGSYVTVNAWLKTFSANDSNKGEA